MFKVLFRRHSYCLSSKSIPKGDTFVPFKLLQTCECVCVILKGKTGDENNRYYRVRVCVSWFD